ncbi:MAG: PIN domain-containing protein [Parachlamydiaceae bacterium]|nr:PIN domain-containing protein [Parachlamydiaceae bacterium]
MMLIDTNIISEMMKPIPDENVMKWLDQQEVLQLFVSTITLAEISYGINILPEGGRRSKLENTGITEIGLKAAFSHGANIARVAKVLKGSDLFAKSELAHK